MTSTPYGLRDIKLTPFTDSAGTTLAAASIDLPYAQTLTFNEVEEYKELRGDDRTVASRGSGPTVEWDLQSGGISLEAYACFAGGTVTTTGVGATRKSVYNKKATDKRPYFRIEGQAITDEGDIRGIVYRARATGDINGEFKDGEFYVTKVSGVGIADSEDNVYDFVESATVTEFVEPGTP